MCMGCWEEMGRPDVLPEGAASVVAMIHELYVEEAAGGHLHSELDDWNLEDRFFEQPRLKRESYHTREPLDLEQRIYAAMKAMTEAERGAVLAEVDGYREAPRR